MRSELELAVEQGLLRALDYQFGRFIEQHSLEQEQGDELVFYTAILLSKAQAEGHVCLDLSLYAGRTTPLLTGGTPIQWPELAQWQNRLKQHPTIALAPQANAPMVLNGQRLYLARYWFYEEQVASAINDSTQYAAKLPASEPLQQQLNQLFPEPEKKSEINWQKTAATLAQRQKFLVITGGPGTGKTTTVIRLLALTLMQASSPETLQIKLVAPTGKAAVRMTESIRNAKAALNASETIKALIPEEASTIHRLLGAKPNSVNFRHHQNNRLHLDLLVVDEASMIDLPLMAKLLRALPKSCKLILLGDKDQLSSVEAGSVLGDLCASIQVAPKGALMNYSPEQSNWLAQVLERNFQAHTASLFANRLDNSLCMLQKSYRFGGGIGQLAQAVNTGHWPESQRLLQNPELNDIHWQHAEPASLLQLALHHYAKFMDGLEQAPEQVLRQFDAFRVLAASHSGELGTKAINQAVIQGLKSRGVVASELSEGALFAGLPLMILRNDYNLKLFNGDIGIVLPKGSGSDELRVFFLQTDGSVRAVLPGRLPEHEVAYAMTIHKSQGSEFAQVALALPSEISYLPLLTKELLYTGITRAKQEITLFSSEKSLKHAIVSKTRRESGLSAKLL